MSGRFDPITAGVWQCCGNYIAANASCRTCGKSKAGADPAGTADTELKRADRVALVETGKVAQALFPRTARLRVVITRGYAATPLDFDNFIGGCKPLRDEIAKLLERDDAEHRGITWEYRQEKGSVRKIEIYEEIGEQG